MAESPPVTTFQSPLLSVKNISSNTKHFEFQVDKSFSFLPGQFVMVGIEGEDFKLIRRAFSIASPPSQQGVIDLCIKILPDGRLSSRLDKLPINSFVTMQGPYGKFVLQDGHNNELLFLAAGTGIAPLRSMIHTLLSSGCTKQMTLVFGFHAPTDYLYQAELEQLESQYNNFRIVPICSTPDSDWSGKKGYVQDHISSLYKSLDVVDAYICGPPKMVAQTMPLLKKLDIKRIFREAWG